MVRVAREVSPTGFYHIVVKGAGDQIIFEDDACRFNFLRSMRDRFNACCMRVFAWCLMDNHVHMLIDDPESNLFTAMHGLETSYARYFNTKTGHKGPVFNDRFKSIPILDNDQLICCMRYIHDNPIKAGIATAQMYAWSSFRDYMANIFGVTDTSLVLSLLGGEEGFYQNSTSASPNPYFFKDGAHISDIDAMEVARATIAPLELHEIKSLPKSARNQVLVTLKELGFSIEQIARLTGIGRNVVQRAKGDGK